MSSSINQLLLEAVGHTGDGRVVLFLPEGVEGLSQVRVSDIVTRHYDQSLSLNHVADRVHFSDFAHDCLPEKVESIIIPISKERALTRHQLNLAANTLPEGGKLLAVGHEKEGIRTLEKDLKKIGFQVSTLSKEKGIRLVQGIAGAELSPCLDDQGYSELQSIESDLPSGTSFLSKPGVFGWKQVDPGSKLLVESLDTVPVQGDVKSVLDLGCGYGYLSLHAWEHFNPSRIVATDNNAAAIIACEANFKEREAAGEVIADTIASDISEAFDLILCNPPFHKGFSEDHGLVSQFLKAAYRLSSKEVRFVVNRHIGLEKAAHRMSWPFEVIAENASFKVCRFLKG